MAIWPTALRLVDWIDHDAFSNERHFHSYPAPWCLGSGFFGCAFLDVRLTAGLDSQIPFPGVP
jgi:hypothetical protein